MTDALDNRVFICYHGGVEVHPETWPEGTFNILSPKLPAHVLKLPVYFRSEVLVSIHFYIFILVTKINILLFIKQVDTSELEYLVADWSEMLTRYLQDEN